MSSYYSVVPWGSNNRDLFADSEMLLFSLAEFLTMYHSFLFASKVLGKLPGIEILLLCSEFKKQTNDSELNLYLLQVVCACGFEVHIPCSQGGTRGRELPAEPVQSVQRMVWFPVLTCPWLAEGVI